MLLRAFTVRGDISVAPKPEGLTQGAEEDGLQVKVKKPRGRRSEKKYQEKWEQFQATSTARLKYFRARKKGYHLPMDMVERILKPNTRDQTMPRVWAPGKSRKKGEKLEDEWRRRIYDAVMAERRARESAERFRAANAAPVRGGRAIVSRRGGRFAATQARLDSLRREVLQWERLRGTPGVSTLYEAMRAAEAGGAMTRAEVGQFLRDGRAPARWNYHGT